MAHAARHYGLPKKKTSDLETFEAIIAISLIISVHFKPNRLFGSESAQAFPTTAAQVTWVCTLIADWLVAEAQCWLLCCMFCEAGLLHVCQPASESAVLHLLYESLMARMGQGHQGRPGSAVT